MKLKHLALGLLAVGMAFSSCKKEEDKVETTPQPTNSGEATYNGDGYNLGSSVVTYFGSNGAGDTASHNFDVVLLDENFTFVTEDSLSGEGFLLYMEMWTNNSSSLESRNYDFNLDNFSNGNVSYGEVTVVASNGNVTFFELNDGSVNVNSMSATNIDISFNLTDSQGNSINGSYAGEFTYRDETASGISDKKEARLLMPN